MNNSIETFTLPNGIRVVFQKLRNTQLVHVGALVNAGSRDENEVNNGIAHFIEHAVFKGTKKRKAFQLFNRIESVGGEVNAYTTRENTAFYASSLKRYLDRSLDLISDMMFNSVFDDKELDKEKNVIYEEIEMYQDSPEDCIYDEYYERLFPNHSLGYNILGTKDTLANLHQADLFKFIENEYNGNRIVISVTGNTTLVKVRTLCEKYFGEYNLKQGEPKRTSPVIAAPFNLESEKDFIQTHCMIGCPAYNRYDEKRFTLMLLNNLLGGNNMGSRLNLSVREKHGYTYNISSNYSAYDDTGLFSIAFACDTKNLKKSIKLVNKELDRLRKLSLGNVQLNVAKRQLQGSLAMMVENPSVLMQSNAKSILSFGQTYTLLDVFQKIDAITASDVLEVANELFEPQKMSSLVYLSK